MTNYKLQIPKEIQNALAILQKSGFQSYVVGGCVRDLLRGKKPSDWDLTCNAAPEQIQTIFKKAGLKTCYENQFGTVSVQTLSVDETLKAIEITPFRTESLYSDKRHPDKVKWAKTLKQDLSRRDFACNAIALEMKNEKRKTKNNNQKFKDYKIIDLFAGQEDIENKIIRAVGKPEQRFGEDALRMMRAVRFAVSLNQEVVWQIEEKTFQAIQKNATLISRISQERIRDELLKIIMSTKAALGIELLRRLGLLRHILPELEQGFGVSQNKHHVFQVYEHNLLSLNFGCLNNFSQEVRLAALLHDIGKPKTKRGWGENATFYNHEAVGAKMAEIALRRLRFPRKQLEKIVKLIQCHLFYYNVDEVGEASVRRLLRKVGPENIEELMQLRYADRIGSGVAKAEPYKLRHLRYLFEKVSKDPISSKMLKINGLDIMKTLSIKPGPKIGQVLSYLLSYCLSYPQENKKVVLLTKVKALGLLSDKELTQKAEQAKKEIEQIVQKQDKMTKDKYWVT